MPLRSLFRTGKTLSTHSRVKRMRRPLAFEPLESRRLLSVSAALLKDINLDTASAAPSGFVDIGTTTILSADNGATGRELWKTDGTTAGTVLVKDIAPGSGGSSSSLLTNVNGTLFFRASDGTTGPALWKSDGTAAGTVPVKDLSTKRLTNVNGTLFFIAFDATVGFALWKSDGTAAGTVLVKDILPGNGGLTAC